jgi:hypothetical protein
MERIRHMTINMLNQTKKLFQNRGVKALRKEPGWDNKTIELIFKENLYATALGGKSF